MRKLLWLIGMLTLAWVVVSIVDHRQAARRRELWAEATD